MKSDECRDKALDYLKASDYENAVKASLEAIHLYTNDIMFASRPSQKDYAKMNIEKCIDIVRNSSPRNIVKHDDFKHRFTPIKTSMKMKDVIGLDEPKSIIKEELMEFDNFRNLPGVKRSKGMLLYGPPGCGKTTLAKAISGEFDFNFYYVSGADILSSLYGESSRIIKELYSIARKEKSLVYIDEAEELILRKDSDAHEATRKTTNQFLIELDGIENNYNVFTICATNSPLSVEPSVLRRIRPIYAPLPDERARENLISVTCVGHNVDSEYIAHLTESKQIENVNYFFSCDDIVELIGYSSRLKWRETKNNKIKITTDDIATAYQKFIPSINEFDLGKYSNITKSLGKRKVSL